MNIQNNIPQFYEMSIPTEELEKTRLLLSKLGFELYEIWSHESGESYETWKSEKVTVKVNIIQQENANDASRLDIVNELDYLFWELRAIKNTIVDAVYEDNIDIESTEKTPQQEFAETVAYVKEVDLYNEEEKCFLFKKYVDPTLLAYFTMNDNERKAIQNQEEAYGKPK